ncbi:GNAT family N-acetyltransferase [Terriglobus tenax]|uniref:GNAT family N-acetyltransferase n=1 Tax=Terriglobus tenax TaxID=1111115 RepID=UPI0021E04100|nr:GNAT family N-acetyltransferase [Terriglobus tenax]
MSTEIVIRELTELSEFDQCVDLQLAVWNYSQQDLIPRRVFLVAQRIGGQVLGAYDGDRMIGFAMGLPGFRNGHSYLHSHMLAVLPEYRNGGIGRRIKLAQREGALAKGFDLMEWTYDPLEIKNSYLNITKLGAISRRYKRDFYGSSTSPLQGGLPTDRLYAEWWLKSDRVKAALAGEKPRMQVESTVEVPGAVYEWKASEADRTKAADAQSANRDALEKAFEQGQSVIGYERDADGTGRFLLGRWDEDLAY